MPFISSGRTLAAASATCSRIGIAPRSQPMRIAQIRERRALHQQRAHVGRGQRDVQPPHLASSQRLDQSFIARRLDQPLADRCGPPLERLRLVQLRSQQREHAVTRGGGEKAILLHGTGVCRPGGWLPAENRSYKVVHRVRSVGYRHVYLDANQEPMTCRRGSHRAHPCRSLRPTD